MNPRLKTASHLERMILTEMRRFALCDGVSAVTVRETADGKSWEIVDLYAPGGTVRPECWEIARTAADHLRENYDLIPEAHLVPDYDMYLQ